MTLWTRVCLLPHPASSARLPVMWCSSVDSGTTASSASPLRMVTYRYLLPIPLLFLLLLIVLYHQLHPYPSYSSSSSSSYFSFISSSSSSRSFAAKCVWTQEHCHMLSTRHRYWSVLPTWEWIGGLRVK